MTSWHRHNLSYNKFVWLLHQLNILLTSCECYKWQIHVRHFDRWCSTLSLSDDTEKWIFFKNVLYCRKAFYNLFSIDHAVLNDVEFKINKKSINFINENDNFIDWADFKNYYFYLHVNELTSSTSINLVFVTKTQFISTKLEDVKLENAKSIKDNITDQQQNSDNIIDLFNMLNMLNLLNQALSSKASLSKLKLSALY